MIKVILMIKVMIIKNKIIADKNNNLCGKKIIIKEIMKILINT